MSVGLKRPSGKRAIATALAAVAMGLAGTPAWASGFSNIKVYTTSHCLDSATQNASKLQMWSCGDGNEQQWLEIYNSQLNSFRFVNQRTGRCITATGGAEEPVTLQSCDSQALNQEWRVFYASNEYPKGWHQVWQNAWTGLCLVTHSVGNGTVLTTMGCDASERYEHWQKE